MRSCRPFSCGEAGWMKCGSMPSLSHQADSRVRPPAPLRTERRPIVAADRQRQAVSAECLGKGRLRSLDRLRHDPHIDQKPAVAVRHRQRVDAAAVVGAEPALEVGGPLVVGSCDRRNGSLLIERPPPPLDRRNQAGPLENDRRSSKLPASASRELDARASPAACAAPNAESAAAVQRLSPPALPRSACGQCMERASDPQTNAARRSPAAYANRKTYRGKPHSAGTDSDTLQFPVS